MFRGRDCTRDRNRISSISYMLTLLRSVDCRHKRDENARKRALGRTFRVSIGWWPPRTIFGRRCAMSRGHFVQEVLEDPEEVGAGTANWMPSVARAFLE